MKKLIAITALVTLFSASVFAAPVTDNITGNSLEKTVAVTSSAKPMSILVGVSDAMDIRPEVCISDAQGNYLCFEKLTGKAGDYKTFNFSELENGNYFITVSAGKQQVKKQVHIYEDNGVKTYFFMQ